MTGTMYTKRRQRFAAGWTCPSRFPAVDASGLALHAHARWADESDTEINPRYAPRDATTDDRSRSALGPTHSCWNGERRRFAHPSVAHAARRARCAGAATGVRD